MGSCGSSQVLPWTEWQADDFVSALFVYHNYNVAALLSSLASTVWPGIKYSIWFDNTCYNVSSFYYDKGALCARVTFNFLPSTASASSRNASNAKLADTKTTSISSEQSTEATFEPDSGEERTERSRQCVWLKAELHESELSSRSAKLRVQRGADGYFWIMWNSIPKQIRNLSAVDDMHRPVTVADTLNYVRHVLQHGTGVDWRCPSHEVVLSPQTSMDSVLDTSATEGLTPTQMPMPKAPSRRTRTSRNGPKLTGRSSGSQ